MRKNVQIGDVVRMNDVLHIRQYKIILAESVPELALAELSEFGTWLNPLPRHYVLILKTNELPIADPVVFEKEFKAKTALSDKDVTIEATFGPFILQRAADTKWF